MIYIIKIICHEELMNILITGSNGFIGRSLYKYLKKNSKHNIYTFTKNDVFDKIESLLYKLDIVFHFAGVNKSENHNDFKNINTNFTKKLCKVLAKNPKTSLFYASSIQVFLNNDYGKSKKEAEEACIELMKKFNNQVYILRLPGIFGEGCKPNYNSVVSTFCFNIANNIELQITNPHKEIELIYINDLCAQLNYLISNKNTESLVFFENRHKISIENLSKIIKEFKNISTEDILLENLDELKMKLFKTYLSFKN